MTSRDIGAFLLSNRWSINLWECPRCFALAVDTERHAEVCRTAAARRLAPCSIRDGDLMTNTCTCGHTGYVHMKLKGKPAVCTVCPPEEPPDVG